MNGRYIYIRNHHESERVSRALRLLRELHGRQPPRRRHHQPNYINNYTLVSLGSFLFCIVGFAIFGFSLHLHRDTKQREHDENGQGKQQKLE